MFDWDKDYDGLVRPDRRAASAAPVAHDAAPLAARRVGLRLRRLIGPVLVVLVMGGVGAGALVGPAHRQGPVASLGALPGWLWGAPVAMPAALLNYEREQFDNFRRGIIGFSDADLLEYARILQRDLGPQGALMAGFTRDVLYLTHLEIDRRGLHRPLSALRFVGSAL